MNKIAAEFLAKAEADLGTAQREALAPGVPNPDAVCFHAQQAIEKLLKAVLTERGVAFLKSHDLKYLADLLTMNGVVFGGDDADLRTLQPAAVEYRYPGPSASEADARAALEAARRLQSHLLPLLPAPSP